MIFIKVEKIFIKVDKIFMNIFIKIFINIFPNSYLYENHQKKSPTKILKS